MEKPFVACAVITSEAHDYLLIKRARDPHKNKWSLISGIGGSNKGLSPEEAVLDEVAYDIGATFTGELCFDYMLQGVDYADRVYVFLGRITTNTIRLNPKAASEAKWFTVQEVMELQGELAFEDEEILMRVNSKLAN